jgi:hypothetical protein
MKSSHSLTAAGLALLLWMAGSAFLFWNPNTISATTRVLDPVEMRDFAKGGAPAPDCTSKFFLARCKDTLNKCTSTTQAGCNPLVGCLGCTGGESYSRCDSSQPWDTANCQNNSDDAGCGLQYDATTSTCQWIMNQCVCTGTIQATDCVRRFTTNAIQPCNPPPP